MEAEERTNQFTQSNYQLLTDPTFIKLKLDTSTLLENLENFLSSSKSTLVRGEDDQLYEKRVQAGKPLCNEIGITRILGLVHLIANNHSVQGNTKQMDYFNFLADLRDSVSIEIVSNCDEWGIDTRNLASIIDRVLDFFYLFLSRTIDNKERESMSSQFQSREIVNDNGKGFVDKITGGFK